MEVKAILNRYRKSDRKVREATKILKGMEISVALDQLYSFRKGCAGDLIKLIKSAVANAKNNFNLDESDLFIKEIRISSRPTMKRWMPRAYGRAAQILKRTCSVEIILDEKENIKSEKENNVKKMIKEIKKKETVVKNPERVEDDLDKKAKEKKIFSHKSLKNDFKRLKNKDGRAVGQPRKEYRRKSF